MPPARRAIRSVPAWVGAVLLVLFALLYSFVSLLSKAFRCDGGLRQQRRLENTC